MADRLWRTTTAIYESIPMKLEICVWLRYMLIKRSAKLSNQNGVSNMTYYYRYLLINSYETRELRLVEMHGY